MTTQNNGLDATFQSAINATQSQGTARGTGAGDEEQDKVRAARGLLQGAAIAAHVEPIGSTAARRAARRIMEMRGVQASETSLADAASDAITAILSHVRRLDKLTASQWDTARVRRVLALYAGRGAFLSLANWSGSGMTGDNTAAARFDAAFTFELTNDLAQRLASEAVQPGAWDMADVSARRAVVRWVFNIGLRQFAASLPADMRGTARAQAVTQARRRCRVIGSIVFGATMASAIELAGFASVKAFAQSCKAANFFEDLRDARAGQALKCPRVRQARDTMRAHGITAAAAWRQLSLASVPMRGTVADMLRRRHWSQQFNHAVQLAAWWRDVARDTINSNLRAFDKVFARRVTDARDADTVPPFASLGHVTGLRDSLGRRTGGSKRDASTITTARGKVSHASRNDGTVSLRVGRLTRALPCAALAPATVPDNDSVTTAADVLGQWAMRAPDAV